MRSRSSATRSRSSAATLVDSHMSASSTIEITLCTPRESVGAAAACSKPVACETTRSDAMSRRPLDRLNDDDDCMEAATTTPGPTAAPSVLLDGPAMVESPRWHDGRFWFAHRGTGEIVAVDLDGDSEVVGSLPNPPRVAAGVGPDAICIDADGAIWVAAADTRISTGRDDSPAGCPRCWRHASVTSSPPPPRRWASADRSHCGERYEATATSLSSPTPMTVAAVRRPQPPP